MIKKVLIAGLFIGGGLYFIKTILPSGFLKSKEVKLKDYEEQLAENERRRLKDLERDIKLGVKFEDGTYNKNWWLNPKIKFNKEEYLKKYPSTVNV